MVHSSVGHRASRLLGKVITYILYLGAQARIYQYSRKRYRRQLHPPTASRTPIIVPGVSILRPLKGLDANLYETLESTFLQEYSNYEIIFSAADERDQALSIVRDLITKYPFIDAKIVIGVFFL